MRHTKNIQFVDSEVRFDKSDGRPAFLADDTTATTLDGVRVERSAGPYDATFPRNSGQSVTNSTSTSGQALRIE